MIGILPPSFKFLRTDPAVLLPFQLNRAEARVGDFSYRGCRAAQARRHAWSRPMLTWRA